MALEVVLVDADVVTGCDILKFRVEKLKKDLLLSFPKSKRARVKLAHNSIFRALPLKLDGERLWTTNDTFEHFVHLYYKFSTLNSEPMGADTIIICSDSAAMARKRWNY